MSKGKKIPMTPADQRRIQSAVDRKPNPTARQLDFKVRTASTVAKKTAK